MARRKPNAKHISEAAPENIIPLKDWRGEWKVLSIREPHLSEIFDGLKWTENRSWTTAIRGRILLHRSGAGADSGIVGCVDMTDCRDIKDVIATPEGIALCRELLAAGMPRAGLHRVEGPICFVFRNPIKLPNEIPIGGKLNFWRVNIEVENGKLVAEHLTGGRAVPGGPIKRRRRTVTA